MKRLNTQAAYKTEEERYLDGRRDKASRALMTLFCFDAKVDFVRRIFQYPDKKSLFDDILVAYEEMKANMPGEFS